MKLKRRIVKILFEEITRGDAPKTYQHDGVPEKTFLEVLIKKELFPLFLFKKKAWFDESDKLRNAIFYLESLISDGYIRRSGINSENLKITPRGEQYISSWFYFLNKINQLLPIFSVVVSASTLLAFIFQTRILTNQTNSLEKQVGLSSIETRPFIHTNISSARTNTYAALLEIANDGKVPADVIFYQEKLSVDLPTGSYTATGTMINTSVSPFNLYPGHVTPIGINIKSFPSELFTLYNNNRASLKITFCSIYAASTDEDNRRWQIDESWQISKDFSSLISSHEKSVGTDNKDCTAL